MIDNVKERDIFEEEFLSQEKDIEILQRKGKIREGVNFISKKTLPKKKRGKSGSGRRIAIDGVEDGAKKAGKTRRGRERVSSQFTASGCHKQNTFEKEGFE